MSQSQLSKLAMASLTAVYFVIYFGAVFARVTDVEFMNVDPRSVVNGINALFREPAYNMHGHYHSIVYGWTYFALNFLVLTPAKYFGWADAEGVNLSIRALLFLIGLGLVLSFFIIARRLLGAVWAFATSLFFVTNHIVARWFVEIHPESTGLLFYLLSLIFLYTAHRDGNPSGKYYVIGMVCLSLSALAKQPFAVIALFTWVGFVIVSAEQAGQSVREFAKYPVTFRLLGIAATTFLFVTLIIHPNAFFEYERFLNGQLRPLSHASANTLNTIIPRWWAALIEEPLGLANFVLLASIPFWRHLKLPRIYVYSVVATAMITLIFMFMQKLVPRATYLYPLYPLYLLNLAFISRRMFESIVVLVGRPAGALMLFAMVAAFAPIFVLNITQSVYLVHSRILLDGLSTKNLIWDYLDKLPPETRLAIMPTVAVPPQFDRRCHIWRFCRSAEGISKYAPDIILVSWEFEHLKPAVYRDYITQHGFEHRRTIEATRKLENSCGPMGDYFYAYYGYRNKRNRANATPAPIEGLYDLSMLRNLDWTRTGARISHCVTAYIDNLKARRNREFTGYDIEIWEKPQALKNG